MIRWLSSLTNRIFLSSALLAVLALGVAIYVVNVLVTAQAERDLRHGLSEAGAWVEQYRNLLVTNLAQQARLIADLPKFKAVVETNHAPTVRPVAEDYRRQISADLFVVMNADGAVLAAGGAASPEILARLSQGAGNGTTPLLWRHGQAILQVVVVPIFVDPAEPQVFGRLAVGSALDGPLAARIKSLTDADVAFYADGEIVVSTLPADATPVVAAMLRGRSTGTVTVGAEEYVVEARTLRSAAATGAAVVILRSRTEHQRLLRALHAALAGTGAVAILLATLLSYAVARTITRPLGAITAAVREMAATGTLTRRVEMPGDIRLLDEDARVLAATLDAMTTSIARFQREAAQRERLSALGRLSTVIAHEIRNPLMIVKAALRTLRREETSPERARQAVLDIEEEVGRLNRLVNDVLDFARPLRFELGPASLSTICRGAANAAFVDLAAVPCRLTLDPEADAIVTDAERLRQALLNLLVNAREAVASSLTVEPALVHQDAPGIRPTPPAGPTTLCTSLVDLSTSALGDDRVRIVVKDTGAGIMPDDLSHVFDPYFTTRRTGSGLGLAITRNIIEGLGGTITLESAPGRGTEVQIDLPRLLNPSPKALDPTGP